MRKQGNEEMKKLETTGRAMKDMKEVLDLQAPEKNKLNPIPSFPGQVQTLAKAGLDSPIEALL